MRGEGVELSPSAVYRRLLLAEADMEPGFHEHFDPGEDVEVETIRWTILSGAREFCGFLDLSVFNAAARTLEAGYWVMPSQRRKGYAKAAMKLVEEWVRTNTDASEIQLEIKSENTASRNLAEALGYRHLGSCKPPLPRPQHELRELYALQIGEAAQHLG